MWRRALTMPEHVAAAGWPLAPVDPAGPPAGGGTGGSPAPAAPAPVPPPAAAPAAPPAPAAASESAGDGFPSGVAVKDMTVEQQAAYWRHQARRHEGRHLDALGLKPGELDTLRKAQADVEELRRSQMTEQELAIAAARDQAAAETRKTYGGRLAEAEFRAASAGAVTADVLRDLRIDPSAYLTDAGEPDTTAIAAAVARLAPAPAGQRPPVDTGGGAGSGQAPDLKSQIAAAEAAGNWAQAGALKTALLAQSHTSTN